ncbi:MAG: hypothetical protein AAGA37_02600 [Actinomycetota bacterium]
MQPTGSVYLDAPHAARGTFNPKSARRRARLAAGLAALGMLGLTATAVLGIARVVIHDPATTTGAVERALDAPIGHDEIEAELSTAIVDTLFGEEGVYSLALYGIDIEREATRLAPIVLDDPAFRAAFADMVSTTHERMLLEPVDEPLDMTALTAAARAIIVTEIPESASLLPASSTLYVVPAEDIPNLTGVTEVIDRILLIAAITGLLLPTASLVHPDLHRVGSWVGRWLLLMALGIGCAAIAIPWMVASNTGSDLAEIATWHLTARLLPPAALIGIIGFGIASAAVIFRRRTPEMLASDVGIAAALGGFDDELALHNSAVTSEMELAQRGLVDVNHPLTNI